MSLMFMFVIKFVIAFVFVFIAGIVIATVAGVDNDCVRSFYIVIVAVVVNV